LTAAAAAAAGAEQVARDDAAGAAWVQLHVSLLRLLVQEIFGAVSGATFDTAAMKAAQLRDLRTATPYVDITTWPEAARRYLAAAATATFLAQGEPKSSATGSSAKELDLPGHLRCMEVQDWAQYLCGGLNMRDLVSRVALLPQVGLLLGVPVCRCGVCMHVRRVSQRLLRCCCRGEGDNSTCVRG
jgi:hypothetical protein